MEAVGSIWETSMTPCGNPTADSAHILKDYSPSDRGQLLPASHNSSTLQAVAEAIIDPSANVLPVQPRAHSSDIRTLTTSTHSQSFGVQTGVQIGNHESCENSSSLIDSGNESPLNLRARYSEKKDELNDNAKVQSRFLDLEGSQVDSVEANDHKWSNLNSHEASVVLAESRVRPSTLPSSVRILTESRSVDVAVASDPPQVSVTGRTSTSSATFTPASPRPTHSPIFSSKLRPAFYFDEAIDLINAAVHQVVEIVASEVIWDMTMSVMQSLRDSSLDPTNLSLQLATLTLPPQGLESGVKLISAPLNPISVSTTRRTSTQDSFLVSDASAPLSAPPTFPPSHPSNSNPSNSNSPNSNPPNSNPPSTLQSEVDSDSSSHTIGIQLSDSTASSDSPRHSKSMELRVVAQKRAAQQTVTSSSDVRKTLKSDSDGGMPFRRHRSISVAPQPTDPPPFNSFDFVSHNPMRAAHSTTFTPAPSSNQNHLQSSSTAFPRRNSLHTLEAPNSLRHYNHSAPSPHIRLTLEQHEELKKLKKELKQRRKREKERERVSMGTKISEGHANYVLMYDMLTGLRISVSRCVAKPQRILEMDDFKGSHKLTFDVLGNELTPSSLYDFKFKDYAPWVFRHLREHFKLEAADYLVHPPPFHFDFQISLTGKYVLSELGSPGKSGSFFYFSQDYRFIIKTISKTEHRFLRDILLHYHDHIKNHPNTLLSRYYGLHRVKLPRGKKIYFVVMGNVFPPNKDIHDTFDLKGSLSGREISAEEIKNKPRVVMKDVNWLILNRRLYLGEEKRRLLTAQLESDVKFLMSMRIMDYSLLTGIHFLKRGNSENIRDQALSVFEPDADNLARQPVSNQARSKVLTLRRVIAASDPVQLGPSSNKLPELTPQERAHYIFYQDDGGLQATDELNFPLPELYFIGIIDILTPYNYVKKIEHFWKSIGHDASLISAVNPRLYGRRFLNFMTSKVVSKQSLLPPTIVEPASPPSPTSQKASLDLQVQPVASTSHAAHPPLFSSSSRPPSPFISPIGELEEP